MALIICEECGKEYSDKAVSCPACGCPTLSGKTLSEKSPSDSTNTSTRQKNGVSKILIISLLVIALCFGGYYIYKSIRYNNGCDALYTGDYLNARKCFEGLNFSNSELLLHDCSFFEDLQHCVVKNMNDDFSHIDRTLAAEIANLKKYQYNNFATEGLGELVDNYLEGLNHQLDAFDKETFSQQEIELINGMIYCHKILSVLHDDFGFMYGNREFEKNIIGSIEDNEKFFDAMCLLEEAGHIDAKESRSTLNSTTFYFKNETDYVSDQVFIFDFYDYSGEHFLETITVEYSQVPAKSEYEVKCNIPSSALNGYTVYLTHYYTEIYID